MKQQEYIINGKSFAVEIISVDGQSAQVRVNDTTYQVDMTAQETAAPRPAAPAPATPPPASPTPTAPPPAPAPETTPMAASEGQVIAPMPGVILKLMVKEGQTVAAGETLLILEAMKMENEIHSTRAGTVKKIHVGEGNEVRAGAPLIDVE